MPRSLPDHMLRSLYAGVTSDDAFARALGVIANGFQCRSAVLFYRDFSLPKVDFQLAYGPIDSDVQARYALEYAAEDPAPPAMARLKVGEAAATDRLFSAEERAKSRFLKEFYHPLGLREALGGPIANEDGRIGLMAIHRGPDRHAFENDEIADFAGLLSHVAQAVQLRKAFFSLATRAADLDRALEPLATGIMIFTRVGQLTHANAQARDILARADGLALTRTGRLRASDGATDTQLRSFFGQSSAALRSTILRVPRGRFARPYVLRIAVPEVGDDGYRDAADGITVYISDPDAPVQTVDGVLASALGLSPSSAGLVTALLAGKDLKAFADVAGIAVSTAKFHLQTAFAATGTSRQVDLVRIASSVLKDLAPAE